MDATELLQSLRSVQPGTWIALAGWLVTGIGWRITLQGQRRSFLYQARNTARGEIVSAFREHQGFIGEVSNLVLGLLVDHESGQTDAWPQDKWLKPFADYRSKWPRGGTQWIFVLEEYEVLFPETAKWRRQMVDRSSPLRHEITTFFLDLLTPTKRAQALGTARQLFDRLGDESALIEDLLVYIQNVTLGRVVGMTVAFRTPLDPTLPRTVLNKKGQLEIVPARPRPVEAPGA